MGRLTAWLTGLALAASLAACTPSQFSVSPDVTLVDMQPLDMSLFEQRMAVTLRIRNPNNAALPVDGMRFSLEVNGMPFATGLSNRAVTVPRLAEATIEAEASVATTNLIRQVVDAPGNDRLSYRVAGTLFLAGNVLGSVPFDQHGEFDFSGLR
jgi:LEA14-like dessication related protein